MKPRGFTILALARHETPHDNLADMDSWRRVDVPVLPGSGPAPRVYDTASGDLVLAAAGPVATLYACGITPYDATHIGHAATYTAWDLLVRAWLDAMPEAPDVPPPARYIVIYVQNVTDVDDPLLERAARDGEDWRELARREIQRYRSDMEALRILPPTHLVGAVEALPVIERFNVRMANRGALYDLDQDLYFAKSADPEFGALSGPGTPSGYDPAEMAELSARARRRPRPAGEEGPAGHSGLARRTARRASLGLAVRPRSARLARRVRRDRHRVPGPRLRRAGGRFGPGVPAPRVERVARPGRVRPGPPSCSGGSGGSSPEVAECSRGSTRTPGWSATRATRCPSRWATWCS